MKNKKPLILVGGLQLKTPDPRNYKLGAFYKLPEISEIPDEFILDLPEPWNQGYADTADHCAAFGTDLMSLIQENDTEEPDHRWTFAVAKWVSKDDPLSFGLSIEAAMKAVAKYGYLLKSETEGITFADANAHRFIKNWPEELFTKAYPRRKKTYVEVIGQYKEPFDNLRAALWLFRKEKRAIGSGVVWTWNLTQTTMKDFADYGFGHFLTQVGFKKKDEEDHLIFRNSYGKEAGEDGNHYFSRATVNHFVEKYGAFMFIDIEPEIARKIAWSFSCRFWEWLKKYLQEYLK